MSRKDNILIKALISVLLLVFLIIVIKNIISIAHNPEQGQLLNSLPKFEVKDINGKTVCDKDIVSMYVFIQFIDSRDINDIDLFKAITSSWKTHNLAIIGIITNSYNPMNNIGFDSSNPVIISDDANHLRSLFYAPKMGTYYLFNSERRLIAHGNNYEGYEKGIKIELTRLLTGRQFRAVEIVEEGSNINNFVWLNQLNNFVLSGDKEYYLFALFTSFCASCQQGSIVSTLNDLFLAKRQHIDVVSIIYPKYLGSNDLDVLKEQARILFSIVPADRELYDKWSSLIEVYNVSTLNNILILVNRNGRVLKVSDATCQCYNDLFNTIKSLGSTTN